MNDKYLMNDELRYIAGDIMGGCETSVSVAGSFSPMERVVLSANGNLQRIMRYRSRVS